MGKTYQLLKQIELERLSKDTVLKAPARGNFAITTFAVTAAAVLLVLNVSLLFMLKRHASESIAASARLEAIEKSLSIAAKNDKTLASVIKEMDVRVKNTEIKAGKLEGQIGVQATAIRNFDKVKDRISSIEQDVANLKSKP